MMRRRRQLTDREWKWLWEYTRSGSNASQAARVAYGGTPISVRVKGHKKKVKQKPFLDRIDKMMTNSFRYI
jgi:predicted transcriptional regulator of viral defense system